MIAAPFQISPTEYVLFVVLEDDNFTRLREYDPAELPVPLLGSPWTGLTLAKIILLYASPEETAQLASAPTRALSFQLLKSLARGWRYRPEMGDSNTAFDPLKS
jgi:hypothetical protein